MMNEVLAFDWGTSIVGILDVNSGVYIPYRHNDGMIEGANRLVSSVGTIVSFNGNVKDLPELSKILGLASVQELVLCSEHNDMLEITSNIRWPPRRGEVGIFGPGLFETYTYYFSSEPAAPPSTLQDEYEVRNWRDCYMAAELWKKWKRGELKP